MSPSATPATRNEGGCHQVPRLPRETKVDVNECHACHAESTAASPANKRAQARHQSQPSAARATPATQSEGGCRQVPRLRRETKVDVAKCHACHAK